MFSYRDITIPQAVSRRDSPEIWNYERMRNNENRLRGYVRYKLDEQSALGLAEQSPYPEAVTMGVYKVTAAGQEMTLEKMRILLGYAARRSQAVR